MDDDLANFEMAAETYDHGGENAADDTVIPDPIDEDGGVQQQGEDAIPDPLFEDPGELADVAGEVQIPDPLDEQPIDDEDDAAGAAENNMEDIPAPIDPLTAEDFEGDGAESPQQRMHDGDADFRPGGDEDGDQGFAAADTEVPEASPVVQERPPKPPRKPLQLFINDRRQNMTQEEEKLPRAEFTRRLGAMWKSLDLEEKETYDEAASEDIKRYRLECRRYKKHHPEWEMPSDALEQPTSHDDYEAGAYGGGGGGKQKRRRKVKASAARKKRRAAQAANDYIDEKRAQARDRVAQEMGADGGMMGEGGEYGAEGGMGGGDGFVVEDSRVSEIDQVIAQIKPKRRQDDMDPAAITGAVKVFLQRMDEAQRADREASRQHKPALEKLKLLPEVTAQVQKKVLQEALLDNHVLERMRDWLRLMPDKSLPNLNLRTELYRLLEILPIEGEHLQESEGLGVEVMELWRNPAETPENKRTLHRIISKWLRPIFGNSTNYGDLAEEESQEDKAELMRHRREVLRARQRKFDDSKRTRARMPDRAWFDFSRRPDGRRQTEAETEKSERLRGAQANPRRKRVEKRFEKMGRSGQQRSMKVSGSRAVKM